METELKPCPFCGGTDLNLSYPNSIYCKDIDCGGCIDLGDLTKLSLDEQIKYRDERWNRRSHKPPACPSLHTDEGD